MTVTGEPAAFDPSSLIDLYAGKQAPDRTIFRIEALEEALKELDEKSQKTSEGLAERVTKIEAWEKNADTRFKNIDEDIDKLKAKLKALIDGMGNTKGGGEVDTSAIMIKIASLEQSISMCTTKDDLFALRKELISHSDKGDEALKMEIEKSL